MLLPSDPKEVGDRDERLGMSGWNFGPHLSSTQFQSAGPGLDTNSHVPQRLEFFPLLSFVLTDAFLLTSHSGLSKFESHSAGTQIRYRLGSKMDGWMEGGIVGLPLTLSPAYLFLLSSTSLHRNPGRIKPLLPPSILSSLHPSRSPPSTLSLSLSRSFLLLSVTSCLSSPAFLSVVFLSLFLCLNLSHQSISHLLSLHSSLFSVSPWSFSLFLFSVEEQIEYKQVISRSNSCNE